MSSAPSRSRTGPPTKGRDLELNLAHLSKGAPPGITPEYGALVAQAAAVVLEHNRHQSGVSMEVASSATATWRLCWPRLHPDATRSHRDLPEAAEHGACGIAFLLATKLARFKVLEKSWKGGGFDFWLGTGSKHTFQRAARLEVSGIINNAAATDARVRAKMRQTEASAGRLPAFVAVVEFGQPKSVFKSR